jgi:thiol-disulfide isomerase/thioredoxin
MQTKTFLILICIIAFQKMFAQNIQIVKFDALKKHVYNNSDTVYVVNFFASWCKPCIQEIPEFLSFANGTKNKKVKLVFVSVDLKTDQEKLLQIVRKFSLQNVYLLNETNANNWIYKIDEQWSGAIPATLIIKKRKHIKFIAEAISSETLFKLTK